MSNGLRSDLPAIYDFYVRGCYAHDGTKQADASINIIDPDGFVLLRTTPNLHQMRRHFRCAVRLARAVDAPVFVRKPQPGTEDRGELIPFFQVWLDNSEIFSAKHVYVHMYGFQFTTSQLVYFECQVKPCLGDCNRLVSAFPLPSSHPNNSEFPTGSYRETVSRTPA